MKRMRDLLQSRGYTPEWKIRELMEMLHMCFVCLDFLFPSGATLPNGARRSPFPCHFVGREGLSPQFSLESTCTIRTW